ncbi:NAD-dependent succinate-semialdehyde dehydrogenase [Streptomyces violaceusniger]|uniref:NAD-dependent succinate-semialdehyde dehydrogenase n=1 Tax=Streptomyces violaceusniger TaxID=68280 RepID=UPI00099832CA|nr:NAD-dependent succinate-semialdehyde dehydrogenase [Streptomyces hygroscopicus]
MTSPQQLAAQQLVDASSHLESVPKQLFIGGRWIQSSTGGGPLSVEDPAQGQAIAEVADAGVEDAVAALDAAVAAQSAWAAQPPRRRAEILRRAYDLMVDRAAALAAVLTAEMGKPYQQALAEVEYAAGYLRWYAEEAVRVNGRFTVPENGVGRILTMGQPVGPCLFVTPWNFPLAMGTRKIGPALAAGCTCVIKPASQTPLSMLALAAIFEEAGLPPGVLNVFVSRSSSRTVGALMRDSRLRKISFTGSTEIGRLLVRQSADQLLRVSMELGGNAPFVVFPDADIEAAVDGAMIAKLRNNGEACTSANRFYVHREVIGEFAEALAERFRSLRVGPGLELSSDVGPLIDGTQRTKVADLVRDATERGGRLVVGGGIPDRPGYFIEPTVVSDVPEDARVLTEEIFGPFAPVVAFEKEPDVIQRANASEFGLAAYVYTKDLDRALRVAELLETGMVAVNQGMVSNVAAPFGGVKQSGFGREGGPEGIAEYLETKYVALNAGTPPTKEAVR